MGGRLPTAARAADHADRATRRDAGVHRRRADRLAQRTQDHPARLHHPARAGQRNAVRRTPAPWRPVDRSTGRIGQGRAGPAPGARRYPVATGGTQAGRQGFRLASDGPRARKARHAGAAARDRQDAAAQARRFAAEPAVLRELGELLYRPRPAQPEGRSDLPLPAVLCLGALPAALRQPGRCDGLPHEAVGGRKQRRRKAILCCRAGAPSARHAAGRPPVVALHRRQRARSHAVRRCAPARLQDHAARYAANYGTAYEREAGEQAGFALAGSGCPGRAYPPSSSAAVCRARLGRHRPGQPVARGAGLGQGRVRQAAAPVTTTARRMSGGHAAETLATIPADLRCRWQAHGLACRPLRVLAIPPSQEALPIGRTLPRRQLAAPAFLRRVGLDGRQGRRTGADGHPVPAAAGRCPI